MLRGEPVKDDTGRSDREHDRHRRYLSCCWPFAARAGLNAYPFARLALRPRQAACHVDTAEAARWVQLAKCAWFTCAATRNALAATVKLGFKPALEGKNEVSTT